MGLDVKDTEGPQAPQEKTKPELVKDVAKSLLESVDKVIEEHGWPKEDGDIYNRFHSTAPSNREGIAIDNALRHGVIRRLHPQDPDALLINLRVAKELEGIRRTYKPETYKIEGDKVVLEIVRKMGFLEEGESLESSPRTTKYSAPRENEPFQPGSQNEWLRRTMFAGGGGQEMVEIQHPTLPLAATFAKAPDNQPDLVLIRYKQPSILSQKAA